MKISIHTVKYFHPYSEIMKNSQKQLLHIISYWGTVGRGSCHNLRVMTFSQPPLLCVSNNLWSWCSYMSFSSLFYLNCSLLLSTFLSVFFPFIELFSFKFLHFLQCSFLDPSILKVCVWWKWQCFAVAFFVGICKNWYEFIT